MNGFGVLRDLRFAVHSLRRSPGFVLIAVITLGLGIGANASMFSILDGYLLRPSPYAGSERLERIYRTTREDSRGGISPADYLDLKAEEAGYGSIAAYADWDISLSEPGKPAELALSLRASSNLFSTLGTSAALGRTFRPDEEIRGNHRVLVISNRYWQNHFGGDPKIIGRVVRVDGEAHEIVGVLPADFSDWRHLSWVDIYRPLALDEKEVHDRNATWLRIVARRSANLSHPQAEAFLANFGKHLATDFPALNTDCTWQTLPIAETFLPSGARDVMVMLIGLSGFVLLIACSNLANLLLARTMGRAREFALRSALGASRTQMLRPLFMESLVLAFAGGAFAVFVAQWTFDWLSVASAADNGVGVVLSLDWRVLCWGFGACLLTALAFGVAPAFFVQRLDPNTTLKSGSRGNTGDRGHQRFRHVLIVGQFALAMVLLAGAALFGRGLHELNTRRHGWESDYLVTGTMVLPTTTYVGDKDVVEFQRRALERLEELPGVVSASLSYSMPFFDFNEPRRFLIAGREVPKAGQEPIALINGVSAHYFEAVGTHLMSGRTFTAADTTASPRVFVINQAMAHGLFGDASPIGRRIAQAGTSATEWGEVVGIVGDVQSILTEPAKVTYQLYEPLAQEPRRLTELAVRTAGVPPAALVDSIRTAIAGLDPDLPIRQLQSADATIARANYQEGVLATMLSWLAMLGLGLASLGIYGVVSRTTAQRTGEFGIRLALGAEARDIIRLVLTSGAALALIGSAFGVVGAFGISRVLASNFPGIQTSNAPVLAGVTLLLVAIALFACYVPARHASRISPIDTLRAD